MSLKYLVRCQQFYRVSGKNCSEGSGFIGHRKRQRNLEFVFWYFEGVRSPILVEFDSGKPNLQMHSMNTRHESGRALLEAIQGLSRISYLEGKMTEMQKSLHDVKSLLEKILEVQPNSSEGWLDATDAAEYMGISKSTFEKYRTDSDHMLRGYQIGGKYLYQKSELDRYIQTYAAVKRM